MSSLLVRVGAVSAALAGVLIIGQEAWGLAVGRITESRAESAGGEAIFDAAIARRLINYFASPPPAATPFPQLTSREVQILRLLTEHLTNSEIADRLGLTTKTIRNHVSNIFSKLQVASRAEPSAQPARQDSAPDPPTGGC